MKFCIFQLYSPLVSWGEIAIGGTRRSEEKPSRSAILGLIGAALGIRRESEEELAMLARSLRVAFRIDASGTLLVDYHTAQVPKKDKKISYHTRKEEMEAPSSKIGTVLSSREYRCDAFALAAVQVCEGDRTLEEIAEALRRPMFHVYLGRKSAPPALPFAPQIVEAENLHEAFEMTSRVFDNRPLPLKDDVPDWRAKAFTASFDRTFRPTEQDVTTKQEKTVRRYYWEDGFVSGIDPLMKTTPYDEPISRTRWQFKMRDEFTAVEIVEIEHQREVT